jgi:hypothetical protein
MEPQQIPIACHSLSFSPPSVNPHSDHEELRDDPMLSADSLKIFLASPPHCATHSTGSSASACWEVLHSGCAQQPGRHQQIFSERLTGSHLQHEAIKSQRETVSSPDHTTVYIFRGAMGVRLAGDVNLGGSRGAPPPK